MTSILQKTYDYLFNEIADSRVKKWTLMSNPGPIFIILLTYLISIYVILPNIMKNRKPFNLKKVLFYYNIFQVFACTFLIYGVATSGWTTHYTLGCQIIDYSNNPMALRMLNFVYYTLIVKIIELIETFFFILRKKFNQVSPLHVYHHSATLLFTWMGCKYVGGGMTTFAILLNSAVHIIMYTYYLLTTLGPKWQKSLNKWKSKLTIIQMIQFWILIGHSMQALQKDCHVPKLFLIFYVPHIIVFFILFYLFYCSNYTNKTNKLKQ